MIPKRQKMFRRQQRREVVRILSHIPPENHAEVRKYVAEFMDKPLTERSWHEFLDMLKKYALCG